MSPIDDQQTETNSDAPERLWIGLDVGGTKIEGVAASDSGGVLGRVVLPTDTTTPENAVESVAGALEAVINASGADLSQVAAVGLGIPGKVVNGVVSHAVNLKLETYPLAGVLSERFGMPVYLENDVRAAALGAYAWVRERLPVSSMIYLSLGTGISAGVILDGRLYRGANGMAGEIGHAVLDPDGERCACGMRGCFETIAAGPAIARQGQAAARAAAESGQPTLLPDGPMTAETVFEAARHGDRAAEGVVRRVAFYVARAIYNLVMHYDVEVLALGGGVSHAGAVFFGPVREELARLAEESPLAREMLYAGGPPDQVEKVILVPREAGPAWRGVILLAKSMAGGQTGFSAAPTEG